MILFNNTPQEVTYGVNYEGGGDCGNLDAGQTFDQPGWDANPTIQVYFSPYDQGPLSVEVTETGTNTTVTIGLYYE